MNFEFNDEHEMVRNTVREFARKELAPLCERMDRDDYFPEDLFRKLGSTGMLGITVPTEFDGSGLNYVSQAICLEGLSRVSPAFALSVVAHYNLCLDNLYRNGSKELIETYVPQLGQRMDRVRYHTDPASLALRHKRSEFSRDGQTSLINRIHKQDIECLSAIEHSLCAPYKTGQILRNPGQSDGIEAIS